MSTLVRAINLTITGSAVDSDNCSTAEDSFRYGSYCGVQIVGCKLQLNHRRFPFCRDEVCRHRWAYYQLILLFVGRTAPFAAVEGHLGF